MKKPRIKSAKKSAKLKLRKPVKVKKPTLKLKKKVGQILRTDLPKIEPHEYKTKYIRSKWWKNRRAQYLKDHPICEVCDAPNDLEVHHIRYYVQGISLLYQERDEDLLAACKGCHHKIHLHGLEHYIRKKLNVKVLRQIIPELSNFEELKERVNNWKE